MLGVIASICLLAVLLVIGTSPYILRLIAALAASHADALELSVKVYRETLQASYNESTTNLGVAKAAPSGGAQ